MTKEDSGVVERYKLYISEAIRVAKDIRTNVFSKNQKSLYPKILDDFSPIPVYEDESFSLLSHAKETFDEVELLWPDSTYSYLPGYFKKFKLEDGRTKIAIVINETENYCEARFYAAKELMHCYLYDNKEAATETLGKADSLLMQLAYGGDSSNLTIPDQQTIADNAAYYGAFEYLVPSEWHAHIKKIFDELLKEYSEEESRRFIAQKIRVPIRLIAIVIRAAT